MRSRIASVLVCYFLLSRGKGQLLVVPKGEKEALLAAICRPPGPLSLEESQGTAERKAAAGLYNLARDAKHLPKRPG